MPIYTGTGDHGQTGLFGNRRVAKDHSRIEAYGTVDELNSFLGLLRSEPLEPQFDQQLKSIQDELFEVGADLATEGGKACLARIEPAILEIERWIDASEAMLPPAAHVRATGRLPGRWAAARAAHGFAARGALFLDGGAASERAGRNGEPDPADPAADRHLSESALGPVLHMGTPRQPAGRSGGCAVAQGWPRLAAGKS